MKRILVFVHAFDVGGVTNVVKAIYDGLDKNEYKVDFVRKKTEINSFDEQIVSDGNKIYYYNDHPLNRIPLLNYAIKRNKIAKQILKQIKGIKYDAIHIHANASIGLYVGIKAKIPVRILHFHEAIPDFGENVNKSKITSYLWKKRQKFYNKYATVKAGDSLKACRVKYGEKVVNDPKLCVLYPPIDMERFNPNRYKTEKALKEFSIDKDAMNIIHVGRLTPVKNQKFIIDVLKEINLTSKANLYFVGDGEYKKELEEHAKRLEVSDRVYFLSPNTSPSIYKCMDCSLLPSFSEAFGMVAVESQLMGVKCYASLAVPNDVDIGACEFLDLKLGAKEWAKTIIETYQDVVIDENKKKQFSIKTLLEKLNSIYQR